MIWRAVGGLSSACHASVHADGSTDPRWVSLIRIGLVSFLDLYSSPRETVSTCPPVELWSTVLDESSVQCDKLYEDSGGDSESTETDCLSENLADEFSDDGSDSRQHLKPLRNKDVQVETSDEEPF